MKSIVCFIDSLNSGGAQKQIVALALLLAEHDYDVKVVGYWNSTFFLSALEKYNIKYICVNEGGNKYKRIIELYKYFRHEKPFCVISYLNTPGIIACLLKILGCRYKLIVSERNTSQKYDLKTLFRFFLYHKCADHVVSNSVSQWNFIKERHPILEIKSSVITNCVDTSFFIPGNMENRLVINAIVVGRITKQKNALQLIKAIHLSRNYGIHVKWYGRYDSEDYYKKCIESLKEYGVEDIFAFFSDTRDILSIYQKADLLILPSLFEGYPNVICEAMSCGLPILCSNVCDNSYLVEDGKNGFLFDPDSAESIADSILRYSRLSIKDKLEIKHRNREFAVKTFGREKFILKYLKLIQ